MADRLDGVRAKVSRGWAQLNGLEPDIRAFIDRRQYDVAIKFYPESQQLVASVQARNTPPLLWVIRIGEIVHNLRSALDHLTYELYVLSNHGRTPPYGSKLALIRFRGRIN